MGGVVARLSEKNKYQMKMAVYKKRRAAKKAKLISLYGVHSGNKIPKEDRAVLKNLSKQICRWRYMEKRIENRRIAIIALGNHVAYFTGFNVKGSAKNISRRASLAKGIFCKWGMENKIQGVLLDEYIGYKQKSWSSTIRLKFTRTLTKNRHNKEMWERFKLYYEDAEKNIEKNLE